eukprot:817992_1
MKLPVTVSDAAEYARLADTLRRQLGGLRGARDGAANQASLAAQGARDAIDQLKATVASNADAYGAHVRTLGGDITDMEGVSDILAGRVSPNTAAHTTLVGQAQDAVGQMRAATATDGYED